MNDSTNSEQASAAETPFGSGAGGQKGSQVRLVVLLIILVIAAGALAYDRLVALKGFKEAVAKLDALIEGGEDPKVSSTDSVPDEPSKEEKKDDSTSKEGSTSKEVSPPEKGGKKSGGGGGAAMRLEEPDEKELEAEAAAAEKNKPRRSKKKPLVYGVEDIHRVLGREPELSGKASEAPKLLPKRLVTNTDPKAWANRHGHWELYRWRRGLPFKSYDLIVIYSGPNEPLYANYLGDKPLDPSNFSGVAIPIFDEENPPQGRAPVAAGAGMGGGESGPGKKGKRPGRGKKKAADSGDAEKAGKGEGDAAKSPETAAKKGEAPAKKDEPKNEDAKKADGAAKGDEGKAGGGK